MYQPTLEERKRVFSMYMGANWTDTTEEEPQVFPVIGETITCFERYPRTMVTAQLLLTPLDKITDEDAVEVAKIHISMMLETQQDLAIKQGYLKLTPSVGLGKDCIQIKYGIKGAGNLLSGQEAVFINQYLISKGYAVPLFFSPGHPGNAKTAIELGVAINYTPPTPTPAKPHSPSQNT